MKQDFKFKEENWIYVGMIWLGLLIIIWGVETNLLIIMGLSNSFIGLLLLTNE